MDQTKDAARTLDHYHGLGIGNAFVEQPDIEFLQAFDPETRPEEPLSHKADLVLDLSFLPAGCWRAGYRMDEIIAAHLQETAIVEPFLAAKDGLDRRHHALNQDDLMASVELISLTGRIIERRVGLGRHSPSILRPSLRIAADRIVAAVVA